jgi:hypothetical protein
VKTISARTVSSRARYGRNRAVTRRHDIRACEDESGET